jgi:TolB-like protein/Tfp pilus assembly protein PilF
MSFIAELKRRNVIRTAVAYLAAAWLLVQVFESLLPVFGWPDTAMRYVFAVLAVGFVPILFAAWVFELTPDGLVRDSGDAVRADPAANRRFVRIIIVILVLAVTLFAAHTFIIDPARDAARIEEAARDARSGAFKQAFGDKSIAVLPFANMSADPDQEFFGDGIAEELLNLLAKVEGLRVISRTSSFQFKDSELSLSEIAGKLDVATILEGSVRLSGNKLRITAQLIDARADAHLWSEKYDRDLEDIFAIQDEVAAKVVEELKVTLAVGLPEVQRHDPEAYPLYLRASYILTRDDPDQIDTAEGLLRRALDIDPDYIDAEVALALLFHRRASYLTHVGNRVLAQEYMQKEQDLRESILTRAPDHAFLNAQLGFRAMFQLNDHAMAARHIEAAIESEPRGYPGLLAAAVLASDLGDLDLAIRIGEYMTARDPMGFWAHANLGGYYLSRGDIDTAIATLRTAESISPKAGAIQWKLGFALHVNGDFDAALERFEREEHRPYQLHGQALVFHDMGEQDESAAALAELIRLESNDDGTTNWDFGLARAYAWLGDADNAFEHLYRIQTRGLSELFGVPRNPYFGRIRNDPRWQPLVDRIEQQAAQILFDPKLPPELLAVQ